MHRIIALILILALAGNLSAQRHSRRHKRPASPEMSAVKQSVEMKKMTDTFAGTWKTITTVVKGDIFPYSGTSVGWSDIRSGPAGNSLVERTRSHGVLGPFSGIGIIWWDTNSSSYRGLWCDSLAPDACNSMGKGQWDDKGLIFTSDVATGQNTMQVKLTYSNISDDSFTYTMETGLNGAPLSTVMTVQYQRPEAKSDEVPDP